MSQAAMLLLALCPLVSPQQAAPRLAFQDDFGLDHLDEAKWVRTKCNDFETEVVDVVNGRLQMAASSVGADDRTVKFHGVRTKEPVIDLSTAARVSFELDWNDQANGCYMTAGAYLCPTVAENPREEPAWLQVTYIGVPPGQNARCYIAVKTADHERPLLTENWPEERTGRKIGVQKLEIALDRDTAMVTENGKSILQAEKVGLDFTKAYLYLQHSTHSNYRLREVFFDSVGVAK